MKSNRPHQHLQKSEKSESSELKSFVFVPFPLLLFHSRGLHSIYFNSKDHLTSRSAWPIIIHSRPCQNQTCYIIVWILIDLLHTFWKVSRKSSCFCARDLCERTAVPWNQFRLRCLEILGNFFLKLPIPCRQDGGAVGAGNDTCW